MVGVIDSYEPYRAFFDAAPNGLLVVDSDGIIQLCNPAIGRMFDYSLAELQGQPVEMLLPERNRTSHPSQRAQFFMDPRPRELGVGRDLFARRRDGSEFPVDVGLRPVQVGANTYALASVVEISLQKRTEETLRNTELRLHAALEGGGIGTWVWDLVQNTVWWDESITKLFGRTPDCLANNVEETFVMFLHPEDREPLRRALRDCLEGLADYSAEYRLFRPDGTMIWIAARGRTERDQHGRALRLSGACVDISLRKQAEIEKEQHVMELEGKNRQLHEFAYVASHDMREPLRMISSYTQLLAEEFGPKLGQKGNEYIQYAHDGARRMSLLIDEILDYSRIGRGDDAAARVSLANVVRQVLFDMDATISQSGAKIQVSQLPQVMGNPIRLAQLFQNLIGNAIKFRRADNPVVSINHRVCDEFCEITVTDNGIGIESKHFEEIFQIFQRVRSQRQFPGNGIGLAICKKIVEQHGGRIWVDSIPGQETTFHFTLRICDRESQEDAQPVTMNMGLGSQDEDSLSLGTRSESSIRS